MDRDDRNALRFEREMRKKFLKRQKRPESLTYEINGDEFDTFINNELDQTATLIDGFFDRSFQKRKASNLNITGRTYSNNSGLSGFKI